MKGNGKQGRFIVSYPWRSCWPCPGKWPSWSCWCRCRECAAPAGSWACWGAFPWGHSWTGRGAAAWSVGWGPCCGWHWSCCSPGSESVWKGQGKRLYTRLHTRLILAASGWRRDSCDPSPQPALSCSNVTAFKLYLRLFEAHWGNKAIPYSIPTYPQFIFRGISTPPHTPAVPRVSRRRWARNILPPSQTSCTTVGSALAGIYWEYWSIYVGGCELRPYSFHAPGYRRNCHDPERVFPWVNTFNDNHPIINE